MKIKDLFETKIINGYFVIYDSHGTILYDGLTDNVCDVKAFYNYEVAKIVPKSCKDINYLRIICKEV